MADNLRMPDGSLLRARDVAGVLHPINLLEFGTPPQEVDAAHPLPVSPFTGLVLRRVPVQVGALGVNVLLGPVTNRGLRLVSGLLLAAGVVSVRFETNGTPLTGLLPLGPGFILPEAALGHVETSVGRGCDLFLSAAVVVSGYLNFVEVP